MNNIINQLTLANQNLWHLDTQHNDTQHKGIILMAGRLWS
jgi:hypothetical protein